MSSTVHYIVYYRFYKFRISALTSRQCFCCFKDIYFHGQKKYSDDLYMSAKFRAFNTNFSNFVCFPHHFPVL